MSTGKNTYSIPENFISEGRIINGLFETRSFLEGAGLAVLGLCAAFLIPNIPTKYRISEVIAFAVPLFLLGLKGINGDPVSVFLINFLRYHANKSVMLFDIKPRALSESPVNRMMEEKTLQERLYGLIDQEKQKRLEKIIHREYILGENFIFAEDTDAMRNYLEELSGDDIAASEKGKKGEKRSSSARKKHKLSSEEYYRISFTFDEADDDRMPSGDAETPAQCLFEFTEADITAYEATIPYFEPDEDNDLESDGVRVIQSIDPD